MKPFLKSRFFWTKIVPTVFFSVLIPCTVLPLASTLLGGGIFCLSLLFILWRNIVLKKIWVSIVMGLMLFLISGWFELRILLGYSYFFDKYPHMETIILALCCLTMLMSVLLCIPLKRKQQIKSM